MGSYLTPNAEKRPISGHSLAGARGTLGRSFVSAPPWSGPASTLDLIRRLPSSLVPGDERTARRADTGVSDSLRRARLIAIVAGIAGVMLCGLVPLLPVKQTTATILWPQGAEPGRADHRHHRPAGVRRAAGPRHLDPVPGRRHPARRGRTGVCRRSHRAASTQAVTACSSAPTPTSWSSPSATRSLRWPAEMRWRRVPAARCTSGPTRAKSAPTSSGFPAPQERSPRRRSPRSPVSSPI